MIDIAAGANNISGQETRDSRIPKALVAYPAGCPF
jgi:hypothetical protein